MLLIVHTTKVELLECVAELERTFHGRTEGRVGGDVQRLNKVRVWGASSLRYTRVGRGLFDMASACFVRTHV
jgi:hypothetical protein